MAYHRGRMYAPLCTLSRSRGHRPHLDAVGPSLAVTPLTVESMCAPLRG